MVERGLGGGGQLVETVAPSWAERGAKLGEDILPGLLSAAGSLIDGVITALPSLISTLVNTLPRLIQQVINAIRKNLPAILKAIVNGLRTFIPEIFKMGTQLLTELANGMGDGSTIVDTVIEIFNVLITTISDNLPQILEAGITIIGKIAEGIVNNLDKIVDAILDGIQMLIQEIVDNLPTILEKGKVFVFNLVQGNLRTAPMTLTACV